MINKITANWLMVFLLAPALLWAEDPPVVEDDIDPKEWGIHNNCIRTNRIKSIKFIDETAALIEISRDKTIMMRLKRRCPGAKRHGISYKTRTGTLCARMDFITALQTQFTCQIESFEPYLMLDVPSADLDEEVEEDEDEEGK